MVDFPPPTGIPPHPCDRAASPRKRDTSEALAARYTRTSCRPRKFPRLGFEPFPRTVQPILWEPLPGIRWQEADRIGGHHARQTRTHPRLRSRCTHGASDRDQRRFVAGTHFLKAPGSPDASLAERPFGDVCPELGEIFLCPIRVTASWRAQRWRWSLPPRLAISPRVTSPPWPRPRPSRPPRSSPR